MASHPRRATSKPVTASPRRKDITGVKNSSRASRGTQARLWGRDEVGADSLSDVRAENARKKRLKAAAKKHCANYSNGTCIYGKPCVPDECRYFEKAVLPLTGRGK